MGLWIDVHAHPGRCFLAGLDDEEPLAAFLGGDGSAAAVDAARDAGMAAVSVSTVGDLRVLVVDPSGGLRAGRPFRPGEAYTDHRRQLAGIARHWRPARTAADIESAHARGQTAVLLTCEGADFLEGRIERVGEAHSAGMSSLTLVHYRVNEVGDIQTEEPVHAGLTGFGRDVVAECNRLGVLIDCAHATFETTLGVLEATADPVMISHSHLDHADRHHPRLLSSEHAMAVASAGGVVGAWPAGVTSTTLDDFVDEIIRLVEAIGIDHVAIGTDMDANFQPVLDRYSQFAEVGERLDRRGLASAEVDQILGGNALALICRVCRPNVAP